MTTAVLIFTAYVSLHTHTHTHTPYQHTEHQEKLQADLPDLLSSVQLWGLSKGHSWSSQDHHTQLPVSCCSPENCVATAKQNNTVNKLHSTGTCLNKISRFWNPKVNHHLDTMCHCVTISNTTSIQTSVHLNLVNDQEPCNFLTKTLYIFLATSRHATRPPVSAAQ